MWNLNVQNVEKLVSINHNNHNLSVKKKALSNICEKIGTLIFFIKKLEQHEIASYFLQFISFAKVHLQQNKLNYQNSFNYK